MCAFAMFFSSQKEVFFQFQNPKCKKNKRRKHLCPFIIEAKTTRHKKTFFLCARVRKRAACFGRRRPQRRPLSSSLEIFAFVRFVRSRFRSSQNETSVVFGRGGARESRFAGPRRRRRKEEEEEEDNNDDDVAPKKKRKRGRRQNLRAGVSIVRPRK